MAVLTGLEEHTNFSIAITACLASNSSVCSPPLVRYVATNSRGTVAVLVINVFCLLLYLMLPHVLSLFSRIFVKPFTKSNHKS